MQSKPKHETEVTRSWPNKVPKNEAIKNSELEAIIVKQVFENSILLKWNCKSSIKVINLNSKSWITLSCCGGLQVVEILKAWRLKQSKMFTKNSGLKWRHSCFVLLHRSDDVSVLIQKGRKVVKKLKKTNCWVEKDDTFLPIN